MAIWSLEGKKILIIDDFAEMRSTLRGMLASYGANDISMASNGEDAVDMICRKNFDIILCDYNLGDGKDGQQILEEVKLRGKLRYSTVFIMVTAESTSFMVMGALEHQPDDYLSKPFTRTVLQNRIKKLLDKKSSLKKLAKALDQSNIEAAIELCDEEINNAPHYRHEFLKLKCELLINEHRFDEASKICNEVIAERELSWARFNLGKILFLQQHYAEAEALFQAIIGENPNYISAYDWLARCQEQLGQTEKAQQSLELAIEKSPKSIIRQRTLADVSEQNRDYETAERARKKVIRFAKNSVLREATDFTNLANILVVNDNSKEALRTVEQLKYEFKNDPQAKLAAALARGKIYAELDNQAGSQAAIEEAAELLSQQRCQFSNELAMELTEAFLKHDKADAANMVVTQLVTNNHDNQALLDKVNTIYQESGTEHNVESALADIRKEIASTNNKGVALLEDGNLEESIALFEEALQRGPDNQVLNINTAQAYIMLLKKKGADKGILDKVRHCLDKTQHNEKLHQRHKKLNAAYWEIINNTTTTGPI